MNRTGWVYDDRFLLHDTGDGHPERPDRLRAIVREIKRRGLLDRVTEIPALPADLSHIEAIHASGYADRVRQACADRRGYVDSTDSAICPESYDIARLAVGGVLAACDAVMDGEVNNAFCAVRPPGHHAERDVSMGFCLFNNIAIAARYLQRRHDIGKVLILDWDVHHGNGTQHIFEEDETVFFCSIHEHPAHCYPGTGTAEERGIGPGEGTTLNLPMMPGAGDDDYRRVLEEQFLPAARAFSPDFVLVSAGFDAHVRDPLAGINLTDTAYSWLIDTVMNLANAECDGRLVLVLEGGYDLEALSCNVGRVVAALIGHA